ncbi:MAG: prepilin-type N-terminal cleavage/methylation domain-containing protein [Verrucomicrobia bacterium]|nr:prepilin-type N-terminal cleavage/methylation domain-containing protein [Verrucomicrobiota bacterium]
MRTSFKAFSLVEVLTAVVLLGILSFIAIPNIVRMKEDSEVNLAVARAEAVNMAIASLVQAQGRTAAATAWTGAANATGRYALIKPYLAFAPNAFDDYMPGSYGIVLPTSISSLSKVELHAPPGVTDDDVNRIYY